MKQTDILFAILFALVFYSYVGYGIILYAMVSIKKILFTKPNFKSNSEQPSVTLLIAAYNEEEEIEHKIINSLALEYPESKLQIMFVTDGSTDQTAAIIRRYPNLTLLHQSDRLGKTAAINRAMKTVSSDIVIFSDANTMLNQEAILEIVKHYTNPKVGCVSGEKRVRVPSLAQASAAGEGLYWKYESKLKQWDAELYSAAGAAGELFSIRTMLFTETEADTILDDFMISLRIVEQGYTIAYEPNAYALENSSSDVTEELKRKVRICAGGFQSMIRLINLLNIFKYGVFTFQYVSHRVLRWTVAPLAMLLLFPVNLYLATTGSVFYRTLFLLQILFYSMAMLGWKYEKRHMRKKMFFIPFYFTMMNYSVFAGFKRFLFSEQSQVWQKAKRAMT